MVFVNTRQHTKLQPVKTDYKSCRVEAFSKYQFFCQNFTAKPCKYSRMGERDSVLDVNDKYRKTDIFNCLERDEVYPPSLIFFILHVLNLHPRQIQSFWKILRILWNTFSVNITLKQYKNVSNIGKGMKAK